MSYLIYIFLGILISISIQLIFTIKHSQGVLKINKVDPEKDTYVFEIDNLDRIDKMKWIRLKVDVER